MIASLDHLVLTTVDEAACVRFYVDVLGMRHVRFGAGRAAFAFGDQ
ncbi:MAG TPA: VOC family protein, partial [Burkholderiaceae bacterium]|nr:VOC family protein [Burkholderiaceae bacterium]